MNPSGLVPTDPVGTEVGDPVAAHAATIESIDINIF
jgi:hypothetical protein